MFMKYVPNFIVAGICLIVDWLVDPSVESLSWIVFSKAFLNICFGVFKAVGVS